jgi:predicted alpha/beta-fold hydrolase
LTTSAFRPFPLLPGGHLQTLGGVVFRARLPWRLPTEEVLVNGDDGARLLVRASWQNDRERPALLLVHGLEGSDSSGYMLSAGRLAFESGWHVIRMNMRGCGASLELCPRLYHAGLTADLLAVARWLATRVSRFSLFGFSLGGNLALLTAARERETLPDELASVVAVSPPLDMSVCARALERPSSLPYQIRFMLSLRASYRARQRLSPELYQSGRERGLRTLREFDSEITAFYSGYDDAEHYYGSVSPGPLLTGIDRPTLVLASADDPLIPVSSVTRWASAGSVRIEVTTSGGHVGFVGRSRAPRGFWAAERALAFLQEFAPSEVTKG